MTNTEKSVDFLQLASAGQTDVAFDRHIHPRFIHHNVYFPGDRQTLSEAMADHARQFPDKTYEVIHTLEDGNLTTVHGKVRFGEFTYAVIHLFRFEDGLIIESWEASQVDVQDSPNQFGLF